MSEQHHGELDALRAFVLAYRMGQEIRGIGDAERNAIVRGDVCTELAR